MKTDPATTISATKLAALVKRHAPAELPPPPGDPIATLVQSFLLWEASTTHAATALDRIGHDCVDFNELRVCLPEEIHVFLGNRYPYADERTSRLRRSLNDLYRREHKLSLAHLASMGKREQRSYIENLDGMLPFAALRVLLLHFGHAVVPVDDQLVDLLRDAKVLTKEANSLGLSLGLSKLAGTLEEALRLHVALVAFADAAWVSDPKAVQKAKTARTHAIEAARREAQRVLDAKLKSEAKAAAEAEAKAKAEADAKAKAEAKAKADADAKAKAEKAAAAAAAKAAQRAVVKAAKDAAKAAAKREAEIAEAKAKAKAKPSSKSGSKQRTPSAAKPAASGRASPRTNSASTPRKPAAKPTGAKSSSAKPVAKSGSRKSPPPKSGSRKGSK